MRRRESSPSWLAVRWQYGQLLLKRGRRHRCADFLLAQPFRQGMKVAAYVNDRNLVIEWRSAIGDYARIENLIDGFAQAKVVCLLPTVRVRPV